MNTAVRLLPLLLGCALLAGCQSTMQRIADCKVGDWTVIGHKDGSTGEPPSYADRKDFCDDHADARTLAASNASARYLTGWAQGNWDAWHTLGSTDARQGLQASQYDKQVASDEVRKHKTQLNRPAYDAGWSFGNSEYWKDIGNREGASDLPLTQREASRDRAAAIQLRFDDAAYSDGWHAGNRSFWSDAGATDARNGTPDSEFRDRAAAARTSPCAARKPARRG